MAGFILVALMTCSNKGAKSNSHGVSLKYPFLLLVKAVLLAIQMTTSFGDLVDLVAVSFF